MDHEPKTEVGGLMQFAALAATAANAEQHSGAQPSNTAPDNSNDGTRILRWGIDSLYLSYPGQLSDEWMHRLAERKDDAKDEDPERRAKAQVALNGHLFEVPPVGKGRFSHQLVDNCFRIQVKAQSAKALPLVYAQVSSAYLVAVGMQKAEQDLRIIAGTLGTVTEKAQVSRIDLCADFTASAMNFDFEEKCWVTRAVEMVKYYKRPHFSGWAVGQGGEISARLYDKTLEIAQQSHKTWLYPLWREAGWDGIERVMRQEFQVRREALREFCLQDIDSLSSKLGALWRYLSRDWLRLAIPSESDATASRWPTAPVWRAIEQATDAADDMQIERSFSRTREPSDESLFLNGAAGISSYMAKHGITDLSEGMGNFIRDLERFHAEGDRAGLEQYIEMKVREKGKRYNTIKNIEDKDRAEVQHDAEAYRAAKDGEL